MVGYRRKGEAKTAAQLYTRQEVAEHIAQLWHSANADSNTIATWLDADEYELRDVPLSEIPDWGCNDEDLASEYASLSTPFPAIVLNPDWEIIDGCHRYAAALKRGDKTIPAYVPVKKSVTAASRMLTLYHGTNVPDLAELRPGSWLTTDPTIAYCFGGDTLNSKKTGDTGTVYVYKFSVNENELHFHGKNSEDNDYRYQNINSLNPIDCRVLSNDAAGLEQAKQAANNTDVQEKVLQQMLPRARGFQKWLKEFLDDPTEFKTAWSDPELKLEYFDDYLRNEKSIIVREDGYVEFEALDADVERIIGDLPVIVFHYTSDKVLKKIQREGLRADVKSVNPYQNSRAGVYVTTEGSGEAVRGYQDAARNGHGGNDICLYIKTTLSQLYPDPDDAALSCGRHQFILPYVSPKDIMTAEQNEKSTAIPPKPDRRKEKLRAPHTWGEDYTVKDIKPGDYISFEGQVGSSHLTIEGEVANVFPQKIPIIGDDGEFYYLTPEALANGRALVCRRNETVVHLVKTAAAAPVANPAFKAWFRGSKVVNPDGTPKMVFHGTASDVVFSEFQGDSYSGWFAEDPDKAEDYTRINEGETGGTTYAVFLAIRKPLDLTPFFDMNDPFDPEKFAAALNKIEPEFTNAEEVQERYEECSYSDEMWGFVMSPIFAREWVEALGCDGVKAKEGGVVTWAALYPEQIKSAISNSGKYDKKSPVITASKTAALKDYKLIPGDEGMQRIVEQVKQDVLPELQKFGVSDFTVHFAKRIGRGDLARWVRGSVNPPVIVLDSDYITRSCEQYGVDLETGVETTILHELGHALLFKYDLDWNDEEAAEEFAKQWHFNGTFPEPIYKALEEEEEFEKNAASGEWKRQWQNRYTIPKGTILYHGTSEEFDPADLDFPAWFSTSKDVAEHFESWHGEGKHIHMYRVVRPITLPVIEGGEDRERFAETFNVSFDSAEDMRDTIQYSGAPGWYIPDNYGPEQPDILLVTSDGIKPVEPTKRKKQPKQQDNSSLKSGLEYGKKVSVKEIRQGDEISYTSGNVDVWGIVEQVNPDGVVIKTDDGQTHEVKFEQLVAGKTLLSHDAKIVHVVTKLAAANRPLTREEFYTSRIEAFKKGQAEDNGWRAPVWIHHGTDSITAEKVKQCGYFQSDNDWPSFFTTRKKEAEDYAKIRAQQVRDRAPHPDAQPYVFSLRVEPWCVSLNKGSDEVETITGIPLYIRENSGYIKDTDIIAMFERDKNDPYWNYDSYLQDYEQKGEASQALAGNAVEGDMLVPIVIQGKVTGEKPLREFGFHELLNTYQWLRNKRSAKFRGMYKQVENWGIQMQNKRKAELEAKGASVKVAGEVFTAEYVINYINSIHKGTPEPGFVSLHDKKVKPYPQWTLKRIDISSLKPQDIAECRKLTSPDYPKELAMCEQYANRKGEFPPVVADSNGHLIDGYHRIGAAMLRGEASIQAYVPVKTEKQASYEDSVSREQLLQQFPGIEQDLKDVDEWMDTKFTYSLSTEPISRFEKTITEMEGTYDEFPQDRKRTARIAKLLKAGAPQLPIFVDATDEFVMEGRHRIVANQWVDKQTVPVVWVHPVSGKTAAKAGNLLDRPQTIAS
jgi:preprotein translocase subunit YajC